MPNPEASTAPDRRPKTVDRFSPEQKRESYRILEEKYLDKIAKLLCDEKDVFKQKLGEKLSALREKVEMGAEHRLSDEEHDDIRSFLRSADAEELEGKEASSTRLQAFRVFDLREAPQDGKLRVTGFRFSHQLSEDDWQLKTVDGVPTLEMKKGSDLELVNMQLRKLSERMKTKEAVVQFDQNKIVVKYEGELKGHPHLQLVCLWIRSDTRLLGIYSKKDGSITWYRCGTHRTQDTERDAAKNEGFLEQKGLKYLAEEKANGAPPLIPSKVDHSAVAAQLRSQGITNLVDAGDALKVMNLQSVDVPQVLTAMKRYQNSLKALAGQLYAAGCRASTGDFVTLLKKAGVHAQDIPAIADEFMRLERQGAKNAVPIPEAAPSFDTMVTAAARMRSELKLDTQGKIDPKTDGKVNIKR